MTNDEQRIRGIAAQRIMEEPLVIEALEKMERSVIDTLKTTSNLDKEDLERLWVTLRLIGKFREQFVGIMESGRMAEFEISSKRK